MELTAHNIRELSWVDLGVKSDLVLSGLGFWKRLYLGKLEEFGKVDIPGYHF